MTGNYDVEHLIALVHKRPVLWNKTLDTYKDKLLTKQAWHEICCELDAVFDLKTEEERHDYGKFSFLICDDTSAKFVTDTKQQALVLFSSRRHEEVVERTRQLRQNLQENGNFANAS